jgi:hypothetical protein
MRAAFLNPRFKAFRSSAIAWSDPNTIGGSTAADRNIVSGNLESGVEFSGNGARDNLLEGKPR